MAIDRKDLPKFGTVRACAACGLVPIWLKFRVEFVKLTDFADKRRDISVIRKTCPRCGYCWREKPLYLCQDESAANTARNLERTSKANKGGKTRGETSPNEKR